MKDDKKVRIPNSTAVVYGFAGNHTYASPYHYTEKRARELSEWFARVAEWQKQRNEK